ncbi:trypsin-like [Leptopilina heterotoma]|uniref:trypsin-like n=1 Tax=Leptopilina heterotoma TaxID=63436 RepID=UPI001CA9B81D|nr:trypsin-like [Leptopilina heterotoma]
MILEAPFMAIILADDSFQEYPFMTGVIISNQWVLTTAKVLKLQADKRLKILTGVSNLSSFDEGNVNSVLYCKLHPQYNSDEIYNDIALIKLARPIVFNEKEGMLPLMSLNDVPYPPMHYNSKRRNLTVFNYGSALEKQYGVLKKNVIGINTGVVNLRESIFVAAQRSIPTCYGDSGSPAIVDGKLVGLLIIEDRCNHNFPNVFVSILHYYDWIRHVIRY